MKVTVTPSILHGSIQANVSKSYAQRAYALAALSTTPSHISRTSWSDDALAALQISRNLGAKISQEEGIVVITPNATQVSDSWTAGESGLSLRMFSAIAAGLDRVIVMDGHGSLKGRPTEFITEVLSTMGAKVTDEGLPLKIHGPMVPGKYGVNGSFSSQLLTGLLIALPLLKGDTELIVINLTSTPYVDMTMEMMRLFSVQVSHHNYRIFKIRGGQEYIGTNLAIEADWSGLAFILVASAIAGDAVGKGEVTVTGVNLESSQADRAIINVLELAGCEVIFTKEAEEKLSATDDKDLSDRSDDGFPMGNEEVSDGSISVKSASLKSFSFDATHCPDLIPPLCVLAMQCEGVSRISGVHRLKYKESDRGLTLTSELGKLGASINIEDDIMIIKGKQTLRGAEVDACGDHRIAMALVCAGLVAEGETSIIGAECISKSYHDFYTDIRAIHGNIVGDNTLFVSRNMNDYLK